MLLEVWWCCAIESAAHSFSITGARGDDGAGTDNEVQRTMLEIITQLDGFDARGNIKVVCLATFDVSFGGVTHGWAHRF